MRRTFRQLGIYIREARRCSLGNEIQSLIRDTQDLPVRLVREALFEEHMQVIKQEMQVSVDLYTLTAHQPDRCPLRTPTKPFLDRPIDHQGQTNETAAEGSPEN
jgi:hypothetical protein